MELLIGTTNEGKVKEFRTLLMNFLPTNILISSLTLYPCIHEISEDGKSFLENSIIKAKNIFQQINKPVLCDDSGLVIDALDGEPGIYSARYPSRIFGRDASFRETMEYIVQKLTAVPYEERTARFVCALAFINSKGTLLTAEGTLEGYIANNIEGIHGFGYDPIFIPQGYNTSLATLSDEEKNTISHRYNALNALFAQFSSDNYI